MNKKQNKPGKNKQRLRIGKLAAGLITIAAAVSLIALGCFSSGASPLNDGVIQVSAVSSSDSCVSMSDCIASNEVSSSDMLDVEVGKNLTVLLSADGEDVIWQSSDEKIADVSQDGTVTGVNVGECTVSALSGEEIVKEFNVSVKKVCYLTFDDGPNQFTTGILDVLEKHDVNATFFVVYSKKYFDVVKDIHAQGSLVAMHTYSHSYGVCYKSYYSYYEGLEKLSEEIRRRIGTEPKIIRFPGGSNNGVSNPLTMKRIINGADDLGYTAYDWTSSSGDASYNSSTNRSISQIKKTCTGDVEVILCHDKGFNIPALETILPYLKDQGYIFETLDHCPDQYTFTPRYQKNVSSTGITMKSNAVSVYEGRTVSMTASMSPTDSTDYIRWSSSDESVAKVGANGTITGIRNGKAVITAVTSSGKSDTCIVTVKIPARTVTLSENVCYLEVNQQAAISAALSPAETADTVKWTTSNRKIATVDSSGNITAVKRGSVTITATADSGVTSSCTVHVINPTASVQIRNAADIYLGKTRRLTARLSSYAYDPITWTSDNPSVATVSSNGTVTSVSPGCTTITATSYTGKSDSVKIYVRTKASKLSLDNTSKKILIGSSFTLNFDIVQPENCNDSIKWKVSNSKGLDMEVSADKKSGEITGLRKGTYNVIVSTGSGKSIKCRVTVVMPTEGLRINKQEGSVYIGRKLYLRAYPTTRGSNDYVESWSSSDDSVATVKSNGVVTAVSKGTATITATSFSGKTVSCQVIVRERAKSISLSETSLTAGRDDVIVLNAEITSPEDCNDTVRWSTSSKYRAVIVQSDENSAEIKIVGKGRVYITVKTGSGKSARCLINCN